MTATNLMSQGNQYSVSMVSEAQQGLITSLYN